VTGEEFYYEGRPYPLKVFFDPLTEEGIAFRNGCFYLNTQGNRDSRRQLLINWYKKRAGEWIPQRLFCYSRRLNVFPGKMAITSAEKTWGSCSSKNHLAFSYRLMMTPPRVMDYVIVHELSHIPQKNHSARFWAEVEKIIPEHKQLRNWLKEHYFRFRL